MTWQRARSEEQIEHRINEIIDATSRLYENNRYEEITFAMIAKEAGFTRSNLYRYFQTKEDIFLELLARDIADWREDVLESLQGVSSVPAFSEIWVDSLLKRKRMIKLFTILYTMLEPNASLEALIALKQRTHKELAAATEYLTWTLPFESADVVVEFMLAQMALTIGIYPSFDPTPKQKEAMDATGMVHDAERIKVIFVKATASLLCGLIKDTQA